MPANRKELFRRVLYPESASFASEDLAKRGKQFRKAMEKLFPALQTLHGCHPDIRYGVQNGKMMAFLDLLVLPQERFEFDGRDNARSDEDILDATTKQIIESGRQTQEDVYREIQHAKLNGNYSNHIGKRSIREVQLHALMREHRNRELLVESCIGQVHFDFPDYPHISFGESAVQFTSLVELVGRERMQLKAFRFEGDLSNRSGWQFPKSPLWAYLTSNDMALDISMRALAAAYQRKRVRLMATPAFNPFTGRLLYLMIEDFELT